MISSNSFLKEIPLVEEEMQGYWEYEDMTQELFNTLVKQRRTHLLEYSKLYRGIYNGIVLWESENYLSNTY